MRRQPTPASLAQGRALELVDFALLCLFTAEAVLRSIALGFVGHRRSYLRADVWNKIDFFSVLTSWVTVVPGSALPRFAAFRALRALKVMRSVRFFKESACARRARARARAPWRADASLP